VSVTNGDIAGHMSPIALFLQADIVVKAVMVGLLLASVWTWAIIVAQWWKMRRIARENERFERDFWKSEDIDRFYEARGREDFPAAKVLAAGISEWRRSTSGKSVDREGTRSRLAVALNAAVAAEVDKVSDRLNILATVGSVAPFVGLFGTVWGIYNALVKIGISGQASIDKVAGPVGEALIMTAIGLAVAVPAVMGYNWLLRRNKQVMDATRAFAADLHNVLISGKR
jgi:biopolymer transport protein TolQ